MPVNMEKLGRKKTQIDYINPQNGVHKRTWIKKTVRTTQKRKTWRAMSSISRRDAIHRIIYPESKLVVN